MATVDRRAAMDVRIDVQAADIARLERELADVMLDAEAVELARRVLASLSELAEVTGAAQSNTDLVEPKPAPVQRRTAATAT
jgi:hypothetical protein